VGAVRTPLEWLDAIGRYLLPVATVFSLMAAAALIVPTTLVHTAPAPEYVAEPEPERELLGAIVPDEQADPHPGHEDELIELLDEAPVAPTAWSPPSLVPLPTATPRPEVPLRPRPSADLPIVMYHHVGNPPPGSDPVRRDLTVSPSNFEEQLRYLAESRIQTVHLDALMEHLAGGRELPPKGIVLTFDDGYDDNYGVAFPLLRKYGMVGTFFVTTGLIGKPGYMTWAEIEELALAGMSIQAQSVDHADLTAVTPDDLARQLAAPKQLLEERLGQPVRFMAYPAGKLNRAVIQATRAAGYQAAVTVNHGTVHTGSAPFELLRVRVRGADTVEQLAARFTPAGWRNRVVSSQ
jgi:peptidoglycan/xylan/chitin deacetylase (PgdA/CDA1 family)